MTCQHCNEPIIARGLCRVHYGRFRRGTLNRKHFPVVLNANGMRVCTVDGCQRKYAAGGMCNAHYQQRYTHSQPKATPETSLAEIRKIEQLTNEQEAEALWEFVKKELKIA